jgi:TonB family protein
MAEEIFWIGKSMMLFLLPIAAMTFAAPPAPPAQPVGSSSGRGTESAASPPLQIAGTISDMDYPIEAIRAEAQGTTAVRIIVKPSGEVGACEVEESAGHPALDAASCNLIQSRFRYQPARTSSGAATRAVVTRRITWRLPEGGSGDPASFLPPLHFASGLLRVTLGGAAQERPRCAAEATGPTFEPHLPVQCFGFERVTPAELADTPVKLVSIMRMQPEGAAPPPAAPVAGGTLVTASAATIEVDPQGRIVGCTPVDAGTPIAAGPQPQSHLCDNLYPGMPAFLPLGGTVNRRAAYEFQAYRVGAVTAPAT